ncbi:hypothetical protein LOD99_8973 [Oopsacas minuta]|uniref:Uncharacterized protein n=1 Tax=Oopsacas minuta TaxID=111878 RepID=A0AAV7JEE0_9METZ|nr:hypothetical protein LOD99_8973 [Oopsacas minuta]
MAMLEDASVHFLSFLETIKLQSINVGKLQHIAKNKGYFSDIITHFIQLKCLSGNGSKETLEELDVCLKMLHWFFEQMRMLKILYTFTGKFDEINDENIDEFIGKEFDGYEIGMICCSTGEKLQLSIESDADINNIVNFTHFESLCKICGSIEKSFVITEVFKVVIKTKSLQMDEFDISVFYEALWLPAWDICVLLLKNISNESIQISVMCKYFEVTANDGEIENELILLNLGCEQYQKIQKAFKKSFKTSAHKIHLYFTLKLRSQAAILICDLKEKLSIKTNFESIERMKNATDVYYDKKISVMDDKVGDVAKNLGKLSSFNLDVIQVVIDNIAFIRWVKENMIDLNEVKAFVDISLTACGGNPMETDRITCFSSVCTNFSPLIFGIVENTSYETLTARCEQIIENVGNNKELTKLLKQVGKNVTFWEEMKRSHGAVEETTLIELDNLMKSGVFYFEG